MTLKITTPDAYVQEGGWDFSGIEATAERGVSEVDLEIIEEGQRAGTITITADQLLDYCRARVAASQEWKDQLLAKFPPFDPTWPKEIQKKWFRSFARLMSRK